MKEKIPVIGPIYTFLDGRLKGLPDTTLSVILLLLAASLVYAGFQLPPVAKAALIAWVVLP